MSPDFEPTDLEEKLSTTEEPSMMEMLRAWSLLSAQSIGGGTATFTMMRRMVVDERTWVTEADFARDWGLVQLAPGINLIAMTILIGRKTAGARGIAAALIGLLLPSAIIAVLLTAVYARVQNAPIVRNAVQGIIPATIGLGLLTTYQTIRPIINAGKLEGRASLIVVILLVAAAVVLELIGRLPVLAILMIIGACGALAEWVQKPRKSEIAP